MRFLFLPFYTKALQLFCIYKRSSELMFFYNLVLIYIYIPQHHAWLPTSFVDIINSVGYPLGMGGRRNYDPKWVWVWGMGHFTTSGYGYVILYPSG
jgi:hypothetical protein